MSYLIIFLQQIDVHLNRLIIILIYSWCFCEITFVKGSAIYTKIIHIVILQICICVLRAEIMWVKRLFEKVPN